VARSTHSETLDVDTSLDLFAECRPKDLAAIDHLCTRVAVAPDRVLLHEGERGRQFFVVTAGSARVDRGSTLLGRVDAGSFVGELSLLCDRSCMATVTAVTPMHLLVFAQRDFHALMDLGVPGVTRRMLGTVAERLTAALGLVGGPAQTPAAALS
jgi:CRP-like cAMP-binding protein